MGLFNSLFGAKKYTTEWFQQQRRIESVEMSDGFIIWNKPSSHAERQRVDENKTASKK